MASSGNFPLWSPLFKGTATGSLKTANTRFDGNTNNTSFLTDFAIPVGAKFYAEVIAKLGSNYYAIFGIAPPTLTLTSYARTQANVYAIEQRTDPSNYKINTISNTTVGSLSSSLGDLDTQVITYGLAVNRVDNEIKLYFNNTLKYTLSIPSTGEFHFMGSHSGGVSVTSIHYNFNGGHDSTGGGDTTAGTASDENGFGEFQYSPPTGFLAPCSPNVPTSTAIDPAETDDDIPTKLFGAEKFTGNGGTQTIQLGDGFQPDCVWLKNLGTANSWVALDSSRGYNKTLKLETADAESTNAYVGYGIESDFFASTGIKANGGGSPGFNNNTNNYIVYGWRANGGTTSTNSDGTTTSTVQANQAGGFSIITYAGNGSNRTIGHGLSAAPEFMIVKDRDGTNNWVVYSKDLTAAKRANLNNNIAWGSSSASFQSTDPSATVITLGTSSGVNNSTRNYVCYAWHSVDGFSKFGAFEGNSNADGPFIYTGFRPRFVVFKGADATENWQLRDTARHSNTDSVTRLYFNSNSAEGTASTASPIDFLASGFKVRGSNSEINTNTIFFAAWADVPFKYNNTHSESY